MANVQPLPILIRRKTHRVRGPRPCSWLSSSSDSSFNEYRDIWPWTVQGPGLCWRRSAASHEPSDSTVSSSSSSPMTTPEELAEIGEQPYYRHARRRKPAGPRAPPDNPYFDERPRLAMCTLLPEPDSPRPSHVQIVDTRQSSRIPPPTIDPPTDFVLDWDVIFEMLGCS